MILSRMRLVEMLNILGTANGNKVMKVAEQIKFSVDPVARALIMSSTDFHAFLNVEYGDVGMSDLSDVPSVFLLNYKQFSAILKASTTADCEISSDGERIVVRTNGEYLFAPWKAIDEFPSLNFQITDAVERNVAEIQSAWDKAVVAVSRDVTKAAYQGVNFDGNFAASDNRRLSIAVLDKEKSPAMLIPPIFGDVMKCCKNTVSISKSAEGNMIVIVCSEVGLIAAIRLIDAQFMPYETVLKASRDGATLVIPKADILGAFARLSVFTDQINKVLSFDIRHSKTKTEIQLGVVNVNGGHETIPVSDFSYNGKLEFPVSENPVSVLKFMYHIDNITDGISVTDDPKDVVMQIDDSGRLWIVEEGFNYLLSKIMTE